MCGEEMSDINKHHDKAMELADQAFIARRDGKEEIAQILSVAALQAEAAAAEELKDDLDCEPTRSILYRSAASLAIDCHGYREAERFIATALAGNPPEDIAEELRDLLENVNFNRHLALRNIQLAPSELQLSIAGGDGAAGAAGVPGDATERGSTPPQIGALDNLRWMW